jgi:hypothetical protein
MRSIACPAQAQLAVPTQHHAAYFHGRFVLRDFAEPVECCHAVLHFALPGDGAKSLVSGANVLGTPPLHLQYSMHTAVQDTCA